MREKNRKVNSVKVDGFGHINDVLQKLTAWTVQIAVRAALTNLSPYTGKIKAGNITMFNNK